MSEPLIFFLDKILPADFRERWWVDASGTEWHLSRTLCEKLRRGDADWSEVTTAADAARAILRADTWSSHAP